MLTIIIPVKNEAENIIDCLNSVGHGFADKIVVIDSNSSDQTATLAIKWGAELLNFYWDGRFPKKRNWYLINHATNDDWILFLDADERLTAEVKLEISNSIRSKTIIGFWIPYTIYISDNVLKYGYPLKKLSLFKNGSGLFEMVNEESWSHLDMEVHEHPILNGVIGKLKCKIEHRVNINTPNWKAKHLAYAKWEAKRFNDIRNKENAMQFTISQKLKYQILKTPFAGVIFFFGSTLIYLGILDGIKGVKYAIVKAQYFNSIRKEFNKLKF